MNWIKAIERWRALSPEEQRQIRLKNLPRKVARSMAFEGEPVDEAMLEEFLAQLNASPTLEINSLVHSSDDFCGRATEPSTGIAKEPGT